MLAFPELALYGANVQFSNTITLGAAIIVAVAGLLGLYRVFRGEQLRSTNEIQSRTIAAIEADNKRLVEVCERQEIRLQQLGAEKDSEAKASASKDATVAALRKQIDALPRYQDFMEYTTRTMEHVDASAQSRQAAFLEVVVDKLQTHDEHVQTIHDEARKEAVERHDETVKALREITQALARIGGSGGKKHPEV